MSNIKEKAYEQGKQDFKLKALYAKNPYLKGSVEYKEWGRGCDEAYEEFLRSCSFGEQEN